MEGGRDCFRGRVLLKGGDVRGLCKLLQRREDFCLKFLHVLPQAGPSKNEIAINMQVSRSVAGGASQRDVHAIKLLNKGFFSKDYIQ